MSKRYEQPVPITAAFYNRNLTATKYSLQVSVAFNMRASFCQGFDFCCFWAPLALYRQNTFRNHSLMFNIVLVL